MGQRGQDLGWDSTHYMPIVKLVAGTRQLSQSLCVRAEGITEAEAVLSRDCCNTRDLLPFTEGGSDS
jgi:hypothetical protein